LAYLLRRLLLVPVPLLIVIVFVFVVLRLTGDPVAIYLGIDATPDQEAVLRAELRLDEPVPMQFLYFFGDLLRGDFGNSIQHRAPAMQVVLERLPATLELVAYGLTAALVLGVLGGLAAAVWQDRLPDFALTAIAVTGQSMPSFWLGILLIQLFALELDWLPTSGREGWEHAILPTITLAAFLLPNFILVTRTAVLETAREQYVAAARSRGVGGARALFRHVLPNALNPIISVLGLQVGHLIAGSIVTETIFAWPGGGRLMIGSIYQRDVPIVAAAVVVVSLVIMLTNLLVDVAQAILDPRVRI